MVKGALVGLEGPWITAAAGVLYAATMRKSNEAGSAFRFSTGPPALAVLGRIHSSLCAGEIPADVSGDDFAKIDLHLDFPDAAGKRFNPFAKGKGEPELVLRVVPLEGEGERARPAAAGWSALLECGVLLIHARASGPASKGPAAPEDGALASLVESAARRRAKGKLAVAIQWWLPGPPKGPAPAKEGEDAPPAIAPPAERRARDDLTARLLAALLPATAAAITAAGSPSPASFFSWLEADRRPDGVRIRRRQLFGVGGVEPEYPYDELAALLEHLGAISA